MGGTPLRIIKEPSGALRSTHIDNYSEGDAYLSRLVKMIPSEAIALYLAGSGVIPNESRLGLEVWTSICLCLVLAIRIYGTSDSRSEVPPQWAAVGLSVAAFLIWVYSIGGPFVKLGIHVPYVGSLLIFAWTAFVPLFYRGDAPQQGRPRARR